MDQSDHVVITISIDKNGNREVLKIDPVHPYGRLSLDLELYCKRKAA